MDLPSLYAAMVEDSPDPIWVLDLDGRVTWGNEAVARLIGVPREHLLSMTVFDVLDEEGQGHARHFLAELRRGQETVSEAETLIHDRQGRAHWVLMRQHLIRDDQGAITGIVHRLSDHEERRAAHLALSRSQERLREVQSIARIEEWRWTTDGSSDDVERLAGLVHVRDRGRAALAVAEAVADAREHGRTGDLQMDVREPAPGPSGTHRWWRMRAVAHLLDDGRVELVGSRQDISEIKETERALRRESDLNALLRGVASAANEADSLVDTLRRIDRLDRPVDRWERAHVLMHDASGELVEVAATRRAGPLPTTQMELARTATDVRRAAWAEDGLTVAFPVVHGDQTRLVVVLSRSTPVGGRDQVEQALGDVALQLGHVVEREEARAQLAQARDAAMEASQQKSEFLATMSHEIRTPLNGILGLNELLLDSALSPDQRRLVVGARSAGRTLLRLINEVLDFSRIEAAGLRLERLPFDVGGLLEHVTRLAEPSRPDGVALSWVCDPLVPSVLVGDPTRLSQVLSNLLANAVKFTETGHVRVSLTRVDADVPGTADGADGADDAGAGACRLRCEVEDTGIGIDPARAQAIFEPFVQGDAATTRRFGGTGLGLAIARDIVSALGGTLTHRARPGGGSVFVFDVVCSLPEEAVTAADTQAGTSLAGRRVLLVSDDAARRATWRAATTRWRMRPADADAAHAVASLQAALDEPAPYDAVLIDLDTTRDGLALAQAVAALTELDDVVMVLLHDGPVGPERVSEAGISAALPRPVTVADLRETLLEQVAGVPAPARVRAGGARAPRVLVVEDNEANQLVATTLLDSIGFDHDVAPDGAQALELLDRGPYDAVLMDVRMPVLDGYDATRALREREQAAGARRVPVVAITASAVEGERDRCLDAGMDDFLTKPVDLAALRRTLHRWVGTPEAAAAAPPAGPGPDRTAPPVSPTNDPGEHTALDVRRLEMLSDLDVAGEAYLDRAIANFSRSSVEAMARIGALLDAGDVRAAGPVAHKIAGSALNLGCLDAGERARSFEVLCDELAASEPQDLDGARETLRALDVAMTRARELLAAYRDDQRVT